jgi:hypothetical protein
VDVAKKVGVTDLYDGRAVALAQERYSWDDIGRRLSAIYEGLA